MLCALGRGTQDSWIISGEHIPVSTFTLLDILTMDHGVRSEREQLCEAVGFATRFVCMAESCMDRVVDLLCHQSRSWEDCCMYSQLCFVSLLPSYLGWEDLPLSSDTVSLLQLGRILGHTKTQNILNEQQCTQEMSILPMSNAKM